MNASNQGKYAGQSLLSIAKHQQGLPRRQLLGKVEQLGKTTGNQSLRDQARYHLKREAFPHQAASMLSWAKHYQDPVDQVHLMRKAIRLSLFTGEESVKQEAKLALASLREDLQLEFEAGFVDERFVSEEDRLGDNLTYTKW